MVNSKTVQNVSVTVLLALLITGCAAVGPDYVEQSTDVEPDWIETKDPLISNDTSSVISEEWWASAFNDPDLNQLIQLALKQNLSLRSAGLRVLQSRQQLAIAVGSQYPQQQQLTGSMGREKESGVIFNDYNAGFNVSWEADVWGRFSRQIESASANVDASIANYDGIMVSLISQVAETYIQIRTLQERLNVANNNIKIQKESLRIATVKLEAGESSELDVDQAETLLNNTLATIPSLEVTLQQSKNSLATLLGKPPQGLNYLMIDEADIPDVPAKIAIGMPQELIRRRPDIRVAERQLASQSAQIGYAETELYPHLSIGGSIGTSAMHSSDLFNNDSQVWNLFGMFEWNIFNYGRLKSNVRLQDALFQQLLVDYRNTVLQAQGDVENSIVAYLKSHELLTSYRLAAEASKRAVDISVIQYRDGLVDFNTVIGVMASHLQQQDLYTSAKGGIAGSLVQVYKSLGGGWETRDNVDPINLLPTETKDDMLKRTSAWGGEL